MKTYVLILISLFFYCSVQAQDDANRNGNKVNKRTEQFNNTKMLVESGSYRILADRAIPQNGRSVNLTTNTAYLTITSDSAEAVLPFFGRAYSASSEGSGTIEFNEKAENYRINVDEDKMRIQVSFRITTMRDILEFNMDISRSGSSNISVISRNRGPISYYGNILSIE